MPLYGGLRKYVAAQEKIVCSGGFEDDPGAEYLLGFEKEKVKPLPVKTYIRRLWLAFQSGRSPTPRYFFDFKAEKFSEEIEYWASVYANDPNKLAAELAKEAYVINGEAVRERGFLEETADILLVARDWGEQLWGHRKECRAPLDNAKPEPGDDKAPKWPQDKDRISMAVRQWIATRLQAKIRYPRKKKVPRVDCPEDPNQRREALAAAFPNIIREDSEEETEATETSSVFQTQIKEEYPMSPPLTQQTSICATEGQRSAVLRSAGVQSASPVDAQSEPQLEREAVHSLSRITGFARINPSPIVDKVDVDPLSSLKRKRNGRPSSNKRINMLRSSTGPPQTNDHSHKPLQTSTSEQKKYTLESTTILDAALCKESNATNRDGTVAAELLDEQQAGDASRVKSRSPKTRSKVHSKQKDSSALQSTVLADLPLTPAPEGDMVQYSTIKESTVSRQPSPSHIRDLTGEGDPEDEHEALFRSIALDLQTTDEANLRSPSRKQVPSDITTLNATPASSMPLAEPEPAMIRVLSPTKNPFTYGMTGGRTHLRVGRIKQATSAGPVRTSPDQDIDFYQHGDSSADDQGPRRPEARIDLLSTSSNLESNQSQRIIAAHQIDWTTQSSSEGPQDEKSSNIESRQGSTRAENLTDPTPTPCSNVVTQQRQLGVDHGSSLVPVSASNSALAWIRDCGLDCNVNASVPVESISPKHNRIVGTSSQRPALFQKETCLAMLPFPPGASPKPPPCSQCEHTLDRAIDIMKDVKGFAQWKKKCIYCRDRAGPRPSPCLCHACRPPSAEEGADVISARATLFTGQVDTSSAKQGRAPATGQFPAPSTEQIDAPPTGSLLMTDCKRTAQPPPAGNAMNSTDIIPIFQNDLNGDWSGNYRNAATAEVAIDFEQFLHHGLDGSPLNVSGDRPHSVTISEGRPLLEQLRQASEGSPDKIHQHRASTPPLTGEVELAFDSTTEVVNRTSHIDNTAGLSEHPWSVLTQRNSCNSQTKDATSIISISSSLPQQSTLAAEVQTIAPEPEPEPEPDLQPASLRQVSLENIEDTDSSSHAAYQDAIREAPTARTGSPSHRPPLHLAQLPPSSLCATPVRQDSTNPSLQMKPACTAERELRHSVCHYIKGLLSHDLAYDVVLDDLIPKTKALYRMSPQRLTQPHDVENSIQALNCWSTLLSGLRAQDYLHQRCPRNTPLNAIMEESRRCVPPGWLGKLEQMEIWFRKTVDMWRYKGDYKLVNLRLDILAIYRQVLNDEMPQSNHLASPDDGLKYAIDIYILELFRTFTFYWYLMRFVDRCNPQLHDVYDFKAASRLFPISRPTAAQCHTAALEELMYMPSWSREVPPSKSTQPVLESVWK